MARKSSPVSYRDLAFIVGFSLGILWVGYLTWGIFLKEQRAQGDVQDTQAQLASLEARQSTLEGNLTYLKTPRGEEAAMRDTLGVAKPGEQVIIVVPQAPAAAATTTLPWWRVILNWF